MDAFRFRVISANNLVAADSNGLSDPYAKLSTAHHSHKTRHINKTLNPEWNENFEFHGFDKIQVEVLDHDTLGKDDPIGNCEITLSELKELCKTEGVEVIQNYNLKNVDHGTITLGLCLLPPRKSTKGSSQSRIERTHLHHIAKAGAIGLSMVRIRVIRGIDLLAHDRGGTSDPYLRIKSPVTKTLRTKTVQKNVNPEWNESFLVEFEDYFDIQVYDENMVNDVFLGSSRILLKDLEDVFERKNEEVVKIIKLEGVIQGQVELGFTSAGKAKVATGFVLNTLGGRRRIFMEKQGLYFLIGLMAASFVLGWLNLKFFYILALGGYIGAYYKTGMNPQADENDKEIEREIYRSHFRMYPQVESVNWMNDTMKQFWIRHGEELGRLTANGINPALETNKPDFIKSMTMDKVEFGKKPPVMDGVRVDTSDPERYVIDYYMSFYSDMYYQMNIRTGMATLPMVVENIVIFAKFRLVTEYQEGLPFIGKMSTSVMELPKIAFETRPLKGLDMTSLPGLSTWLNDTINTSVIQGMLLYPQKIVFLDLTKKIEAAIESAAGITNVQAPKSEIKVLPNVQKTN